MKCRDLLIRPFFRVMLDPNEADLPAFEMMQVVAQQAGLFARPVVLIGLFPRVRSSAMC